MEPSKIINYALALVLIAIIMPIALVFLGTMDVQQITVNGTVYTVGDVVDSSVLTMFMVILPLVGAIAIIGYFLKKRSG